MTVKLNNYILANAKPTQDVSDHKKNPPIFAMDLNWHPQSLKMKAFFIATLHDMGPQQAANSGEIEETQSVMIVVILVTIVIDYFFRLISNFSDHYYSTGSIIQGNGTILGRSPTLETQPFAHQQRQNLSRYLHDRGHRLPRDGKWEHLLKKNLEQHCGKVIRLYFFEAVHVLYHDSMLYKSAGFARLCTYSFMVI